LYFKNIHPLYCLHFSSLLLNFQDKYNEGNVIDLRKDHDSPQRHGGRREESFSLAVEGSAREKACIPLCNWIDNGY